MARDFNKYLDAAVRPHGVTHRNLFIIVDKLTKEEKAAINNTVFTMLANDQQNEDIDDIWGATTKGRPCDHNNTADVVDTKRRLEKERCGRYLRNRGL